HLPRLDRRRDVHWEIQRSGGVDDQRTRSVDGPAEECLSERPRRNWTAIARVQLELVADDVAHDDAPVGQLRHAARHAEFARALAAAADLAEVLAIGAIAS